MYMESLLRQCSESFSSLTTFSFGFSAGNTRVPKKATHELTWLRGLFKPKHPQLLNCECVCVCVCACACVCVCVHACVHNTNYFTQVSDQHYLHILDLHVYMQNKAKSNTVIDMDKMVLQTKASTTVCMCVRL